MFMNKKFSTLLMGVAMLGSVSASAKLDSSVVGKLTTVKMDGKYLTTKTTAAGADSLVLVASQDADVLSAAYKKTLWKFEKSTAVSGYEEVYKITNYGTGTVLSLDLSKKNATKGAVLAENGQALWNVANDGNIDITIGGKTYALVVNAAGAVTLQQVTTGTSVIIETVNKTKVLTYEQMNGLYNTSFVLNFTKEVEGNPLDGVAVVAETATLSSGIELDGYLNFKFADGKYLVVDTATWAQSTNKDFSYYKLTTDVKPTDTKETYANNGTPSTVLENGRSARFYAFKAEVNVGDGYTITITPQAVPALATDAPAVASKREKPGYVPVQEDVKPLSYGDFAGGTTVMAAFSDPNQVSAFTPAKATFGEATAPATLDKNYTYYIKNAKTTGKNIGKYFVYDNCNETVSSVSSVTDVPSDLWYLDSNVLKNMLNNNKIKGTGFITLIDETTSTYAFGTDTLQLVKGPKVVTIQANSYKKISKDDYVNGALSFMLKSDLAEDLYLCEKSGDLYVEASDLETAAKFKVTPVEEEAMTVTNSNGIVVNRYFVTNRLGTKVLAWVDGTTGIANGEIAMIDVEKATIPAWVAFEYLGSENEYKIVFPGTEFALAAKAGSGITFLTGLCDLENTTFVFAKKDAPTYGKPAVGHVKITTLEDDGKYLASQKDGYAALKAEGQSLKSEDVYTSDTLTMWLDTACVKFDAAMPLYYISTSAFNEEGTETRNYLMNTANIFDSKGNQIYAYEPATGDEEAVRAAYIAASVCGTDSLAIAKDTINSMKLNPAAVAFEVAADVNDETYRIVSILNEKTGVDVDDKPIYEARTMYLAHLNNVLYWTTYGDQAELFVIERAATPTANETIAASAVTVIAGEGNVTIAGAAGKKVVIANILGQTIANTVLTSDNVTIAAPAGVVVVAVEGEAAVKAIVK